MENIKNEFDSIKHLINKYEFEGAFNGLFHIAVRNGLENILANFVYSDYINGMIAERENGWGSIEEIYYRIKNIDSINEEVFYMDGYGNLRNITKEDLETLYEELYEAIIED